MKKIILVISSAISGLLLLIGILSIKLLFPFKPSFYSYSSYADQKTIDQISQKYTYKEYGSATDFEYYLENNKAIAGVASDYSIISLINDGKLYPISGLIKEQNKLSGDWESYFTEQAQDQMRSFDQYLNQSKWNDQIKQELGYDSNYTLKFSDFVVPYFINDKLIALDTSKLGFKELTFDKPPTLEEALITIREQNKNNNFKMQWTKNERENIVYGSTINNPKENWDTKITNSNYESWLNNFAQIVQKGTNAPMNDIKINLFENDSDVILNNLINPTSNINVASIYNGDALDAYYGHDNFQDIVDGDRVRIIRTKYTIRILDCFVVSSSIDINDLNQVLKDFNQTLFNGMFWTKDEISQKAETEDVYTLDGIMRIFDYVNYSPAAKGAYQYIDDNYFLLDENNNLHDEIARDIYRVASTDPEKEIYVKNLAPIDKETLSKLKQLFQERLNGY